MNGANAYAAPSPGEVGAGAGNGGAWVRFGAHTLTATTHPTNPVTTTAMTTYKKWGSGIRQRP